VLALLELKIVLALVARKFDVVPAYAEFDAAAAAAAGARARGGGDDGGSAEGRVRTYRGKRPYPGEMGLMQPIDGYPCRVSLNPAYAGGGGGSDGGDGGQGTSSAEAAF
jgi:hypothetical protein